MPDNGGHLNNGITERDLQKIRAIFREEIAGSEQRITTATTANLSDLREEIKRRFDQFDQRFEFVERRLDRIEHLMIGFNKSLTDAERLDTRMSATQIAQQRAIDDLVHSLRDLSARVAKLEQALGQQ
jgi:transcriptional regulator of heat shock response